MSDGQSSLFSFRRRWHMHSFGCGRPGACPDQLKGVKVTDQDLIGKTVRIVGMDTGGGAGQDDFVSHICLEVEGRRVFVQATDPAHTWEIKADAKSDIVPLLDGDLNPIEGKL